MAENQLNLFGAATPRATPVRLGHAEIAYRPTASILTPATGFMADFDYTLNPYTGCSFGCTYCYAAFFVRDSNRQATWGRWVDVKENALERLRRMRGSLRGKTIYMSSVTDPYQPIERQLGLTRSLLEALAPHQPRLVVQTRSALVTRDIDLYRQFEHVRINMTVTTDIEEIRRVFEPWCPTAAHRLAAIAEVAAAGLPTCITMTPLLPIESAEAFADALMATRVPRFVVQPFHRKRGRFVAGTRDEATRLLDRFEWDDAAYRRVVDVFERCLPRLDQGQAGFEPA